MNRDDINVVVVVVVIVQIIPCVVAPLIILPALASTESFAHARCERRINHQAGATPVLMVETLALCSLAERF